MLVPYGCGLPFFTPHIATRGAAISTEVPHEGATYPYPLLITLPERDEQEVHDLAQVIHRHYDEYKNADPGAIGWALDRQIKQWQVPYHKGSVRYLKSIDAWSDADDAHNQRLIKRQEVLASAWQKHVQAADGSADFRKIWYAQRASALQAAGFDPIWLDPGSG